ncbi:MAG: acyl-CoA dehydratase activase-related protein [Paludibacter sp.]|nr:acyl-CoA dehydratase activase-related protein [Paludibacter sp.]MCM1576726.1 acyl-CoA dehydratase activase-related protein [Bacteroides sp.]
MNLSELTHSNTYREENTRCTGCDNQCRVRLFHFANGKTFASGNNCERIYSNAHESSEKGINLIAEKYRLLFNRPTCTTDTPILRIGIPRGLGIYENYPFWNTLFTQCGIEVVLSRTSTYKLYEKGVQTIMADNICFPAKLMHGHVADLLSQNVNRIFYPFVVYERREDSVQQNSFNCPIVSAYSDVLKSSMDTAARYNVPLDAPVLSFNNERLLEQACTEYLHTLGISSKQARHAVKAAIAVQDEYTKTLTRRANEILHNAIESDRTVILLAGRPYHSDPLIEHKISHAIADMGADVITEHIAIGKDASVWKELNAVTQWSYPNRIFKAAHFVGTHSYAHLQMVQLTSFGCGPDAFILDEVGGILRRYHKNLTVLKIDDVNNIGSLRLRVRSLLESTRLFASSSSSIPAEAFVTTRTFTEADKQKTILAPYFAEGYSEFLPSLLKLAGYTLVNLPSGSQHAAEIGLRYANNDVCYPATIVIGSIMDALESGKYDLKNTAVIITQTGGQCRASNYYSLIKNAMVSAGYADIPLLSLATGAGIENQQPGFHIEWKRLAKILIHTMAFADCLSKLYYASAPREIHKGSATLLRRQYTEKAFPLIEHNDSKGLQQLMCEAAQAFTKIIEREKQVPVMGVVGEIYVKYNGFSHKFVTRWLVEEGIEVVPPSLIDFFSTTFVGKHANRELHIKEENVPLFVTDSLYKYIHHIVKGYDRICQRFPYYRPSANIFDIAHLSKQVISTAADFGEGWFLPGEICHLAENGVNNVVSLQPFGCIANHIISKGIEKKIRTVYPQLNLLFLDFDSSTSEANIYNRLHFMVENARKNLIQQSN